MMGVKVHNITVNKDGMAYNYDPDKKTGNKMSLSPTQNIDFSNLTEEIKKEMKLEKTGEEDILGKPCIKYSINYDKYKMKGFFWVWEGLPLKTEIDMAGIKVNLEAVKVEENVPVPAEKFEIPTDVKFQ